LRGTRYFYETVLTRAIFSDSDYSRRHVYDLAHKVAFGV